jgi:hypothetical protein
MGFFISKDDVHDIASNLSVWIAKLYLTVIKNNVQKIVFFCFVKPKDNTPPFYI